MGTNSRGDWRLGPHGCTGRSGNGERLLGLLSAWGLFHGNSTFEIPARRRWTWESQREDIANYRPISLLSVVYESFTKILLNRVERILDEYQPVEQIVFRKNFPYMDSVRGHSAYWKEPRISPSISGAPPDYIQLLEQCFSNTTTTIQLFKRKIKIPIQKRVWQGNTISPNLFMAALQYAMSNLNWQDKGCPINGKKMNNLRFADDIVLISINRNGRNGRRTQCGRPEDRLINEH
ncbi:hypothetical protein OSTOST_04365, partial [Ostertagia ostertagi]